MSIKERNNSQRERVIKSLIMKIVYFSVTIMEGMMAMMGLCFQYMVFVKL